MSSCRRGIADGNLMTSKSRETAVQPTLVKEVADIQIWPRKEWMKADVTATIMDAGSNEVEFILAVSVPESNGKFDVLGVFQGNEACRFHVAPDRLIVEPTLPTPCTEFRILYEGQARQDSEDFIRHDEIMLRTDGNWLPVLSSTCADFEITLRHPSGYTFFGQGESRLGLTRAGLRASGFSKSPQGSPCMRGRCM